MKKRISFILALTLLMPICRLLGQGSAFTYQGRLNDANGPANGAYDLAFSLFSTDSGGLPIAGALTNSATLVTNGLFTTTLDFGPSPFSGATHWLEIAVRTSCIQATLTANAAMMMHSGKQMAINTSIAPRRETRRFFFE